MSTDGIVERLSTELERDRDVERHNWPSRWTFAWLTLGLAVFAAYLSLVPFRYVAVPIQTALPQFEHALAHTVVQPSRADFAANAFFFVFVGATLTGALVLDRRPVLRMLAIPTVGVLTLPFSLALEFAQVFFPDRVVSSSDVLAETSGALAGALLWALVGQAAVDWLRGTREGAREAGWLSRVTGLYCAAYAVAALMPFDFTIDPSDLSAKYRAGRIVIVPFANTGHSASLAWHIVWTAAAAVPVGMLACVLWRGGASGLRLAWSVTMGSAAVAALELAQVFLPSRFADVTDVLAGALGVAVGALLARAWTAGDSFADALPPTAATGRLALAAALLTWSVLVVAYHWAPFDFVTNADALDARLRELSLMPFAGYYHSPPLVAFEQVFTKAALGAPLGALSGRLLGRPRGPHARLL